jgi:uncharacterized membrane protein YecN with MAPEG domain
MRDFTVPDPGSVVGAGFIGVYLVGALLLSFAMPSRRHGQRVALSNGEHR